MEFIIEGRNFVLDGKKVFLNSGEIHYFRIKKEFWDQHLLAAKEAGLMAVSTYVPWAWHEPKEKLFDLVGDTSPERDLKTWLELCEKYGLYCILKPGPFILAEFRGAGLPDWFIDKYGDDIRMHDSAGSRVNSEGVSLFHPAFIEKVGFWYDNIMSFVSKRQLANGGPVIMMQVCNEIGVFSWLAHQADYNERVRASFISYLSEKYRDIDSVNQIFNKNYKDFSSIVLPPDGSEAYNSVADRAMDHEWHMFWRKYYGDYLRLLASMIRDRGVDVPLYHNLPGWIYGSGYEFPVNISMYEDLYGERSDIIFGVDHIPEFVSYRNMHDDRIINDITMAMQGQKPLFAAEFQCGSREYHVVTNPQELELFYKASIANGLTGWNYYMFSQGRNPERKGYSGSTFYWFNPLSPEAKKNSSYPLVKRMSRLIKTNEEIIVNSSRKSEICVLFYPPYYATELERPVSVACGLVFDFSAIRRPAYFDGLLKAIQILNVDYDMADLSRVTVQELLNYKQVWAFATDEMDQEDQETLLGYAKKGGNLVIFPYIPDREMNGKPCTVLRDEIRVQQSGLEYIDSALIDVFEHKDIKCANPQVLYDALDLGNDEIIARTIQGNICGFNKKTGHGNIIHLGTWIGFDTESHKDVYRSLLNLSDASISNSGSDNEFLIVRERFDNDSGALLFIGNYYNEDHIGNISYRHPVSGEQIDIPYSGQSINVPGLYGILTPIRLSVIPGLYMLHTTSDILDIKATTELIEIVVYGHRDLEGEMVFEGDLAIQVKKLLIDNDMIRFDYSGNRLKVNYSHKHRSESLIKIFLHGN